MYQSKWSVTNSLPDEGTLSPNMKAWLDELEHWLDRDTGASSPQRSMMNEMIESYKHRID